MSSSATTITTRKRVRPTFLRPSPLPRRGRVNRISRSLSLPRELSRVQNHITPAVCSIAGGFSINSNTGFAAVAQSLVFAFTANNVVFSLGGGAYATFTSNYANASSFNACYDQYRIRKVVCTVSFTSNSSVTSSTTSLPNLYAVLDYNDGDAIVNNADALSYSSCKFMQLGNSSGEPGGLQYITLTRPTVQVAASTTTLGTLTGSIARVSPWIDTDAPTVEHLGMKFWTDTPAGLNSISGQCQFTFRVFIDYKNIA